MRAWAMFLVAVLLLPVSSAQDIDRNAVHNVFTVDALFDDWNTRFPDFVERITIGQSEGGFPLHGVIVTDESVPFDDPPHTALAKWRVYMDGGHHGNEFLGVEIMLYYLEDVLTQAAAGDEHYLEVLRTTEIQAVPILNVEGNLRDTRVNLNGFDPNRNYDFGHTPCPIPNGFTCGGPEPFSESEIRANADHVITIDPDLWLSMHTGIEVLYYPAGDPFPDGMAIDQPLWTAMEEPFESVVNHRIDMVGGPAPAVGSAEDWGYAILGIQSFVYEVHNDQFLPVYGEPISQLLIDQIRGMAWLVENPKTWGAWVEVVPGTDGLVAINHGMGEARSVVIKAGDDTTTLESLGAGNFTTLDLNAGEVAWEYPVLLVDSSRVRDHSATFDGSGPENDKATPFGVPVALALAIALVVRRRIP